MIEYNSILNKFTLIIVFWISFLFFPNNVFGATYYVSSLSGNDSDSGTQSSPFKTIEKGIEISEPGDVVSVEPGTYLENMEIEDKHGAPDAPIRIIGEATDPSNYPVIDGGDPDFNPSRNKPAVLLKDSSWLVFERLKLVNSSESSYYIQSSNYIVVRRNILDFHSFGVLLRYGSNHILFEYNEAYQSFPVDSIWDDLKNSKWEGGAFTSYGGGSMNVVRYNNFHDQFNSIYLDYRDGYEKWRGANLWIYRNRFERIVDDPYEPEGHAFNNHFFQNTLIDAHRLVSLVPEEGRGLEGPIYIYNNMMVLKNDPTLQADSGRVNSAIKLGLDYSDYFVNGVYFFNNSVDVSGPGVNGFGVDFDEASSVKNFNHWNNAYKIERRFFEEGSDPGLVNSDFDYDMVWGNTNYTEVHGWSDTEPGFSDASNEDLRLNVDAEARGKSREIELSLGFRDSLIIGSGTDLGAFDYGASDFRNVSSPVYAIPTGGEVSGFPENVSWPEDTTGGFNPVSGPKWLGSDPINIPGDANEDGKVDGIDYVIWLNNYQQEVTDGHLSGDFDNSGIVDGIDYVIWLNNYKIL